ncbi:MAG: acyl carrier protein [Candidatus Acidiferrales bacterium]
MTASGPVNDRIRSFILETFPLARKHNLKDGDNLLDSGILDSLGMLDVVSFLEREFSIHVDDEELIPENFLSVEKLAAFAVSKTSSGTR